MNKRIDCIKMEYRMNIRSFLLPLFFLGVSAFAELPTAKDLAAKMGFGINIGNTMEAISGNTDTGVITSAGPEAWGGKYPNKEFITAIKNAGYSTVRIPVSWYAHADTVNNVIHQSWMDSVKTVVDLCVNAGLYTIINIHWDFGWLEKHIDKVDAVTKDRVNARQKAFWTQIATAFKEYDEHLLFASANEPDVNDQAGDEAHQTLLLYHQTFVDAVRETGGNNASRSLIIQAASTSFDLAYSKMVMPTDKISDRLMAEVHFYPYTFTLMDGDADWGKASYYWGDYLSTTDPERNATWCGKEFVDENFDKMKEKFTSKGIPVVIGEFGAMSRSNILSGADLELHIKGRAQFYGYVAKAAKDRGMIPITWETGGTGPGTMTTISTADYTVFDYPVMNAIRTAYGLPELTKGAETNKMLVATYDYFATEAAKGDSSTYGQISFDVVKSDITPYTSITIKANISGTTSSDGKYGYTGFNVVTMSSDEKAEWQWREFSILGGKDPVWGKWHEYKVPLSQNIADSATALISYNPKKIVFIGIQSYLQYFKGSVAIDYIAFNKADGTADTLYSFNSGLANKDGAVTKLELLPYSETPSGLIPARRANFSRGFVIRDEGFGNFTVVSDRNCVRKFVVTDALGKVLTSKTVRLSKGENRIRLGEGAFEKGFVVVK